MPSWVTTNVSGPSVPEQHQGVEAGAAFDTDRRVDVVLDGVVAAAAGDADVGAGRDQEGAHDERVVAAAADQRKIGLVGIDLERVGSRAAIERGRFFDAVGQRADPWSGVTLKDVAGEAPVPVTAPMSPGAEPTS